MDCFQEHFKSGLLLQSDAFKKQVTTLLEEFHLNGPFHADIPSGDAMEAIGKLRENTLQLKKQEQVLRNGLGMFKIDQPTSKEIIQLEKVSDCFYFDF